MLSDQLDGLELRLRVGAGLWLVDRQHERHASCAGNNAQSVHCQHCFMFACLCPHMLAQGERRHSKARGLLASVLRASTSAASNEVRRNSVLYVCCRTHIANCLCTGTLSQVRVASLLAATETVLQLLHTNTIVLHPQVHAAAAAAGGHGAAAAAAGGGGAGAEPMVVDLTNLSTSPDNSGEGRTNNTYQVGVLDECCTVV